MSPHAAAPSPAPSSSEDAGGQDIPLCHAVADLYSPAARAIARRHLAPVFEEQQTTPLEVLHSAGLQTIIGNHPLCRTMVDAIADVQAPLTRQSVATRARDLRGLLDKTIEETGKLLKAHPPAEVSAASFPDLVTRHGNPVAGENVAADFPLFSALARTLAPCRDRSSRITLLADLIDSPKGTPSSLAYLDMMLAEHLAARGTLRTIWSTSENVCDFLSDLIILLEGKELQNVALETAMARRLEKLFLQHSLPHCREALVSAIQNTLETADRLVKTVENDLLGQRLMMAELSSTAEIAARLHHPDGFIGGRRTHDILDRRVSLLVSTDKLQELTRGKSILEKLRDLFQLQGAVHGTSSTRTIDDYIIYLLEGRDFMGRLGDSIDNAEDRIRALSELQMMVLGSHLSTGDRKRLATLLDASQHDVIKTTTLFSTLRKESKPPINAILHVVDMAGEGQFTHGKCLAEARELVRRHVRHKDFLRKYLHRKDGIREANGDEAPASVGERLTSLAARMEKAGIEFRDLSALRVLVCDDEDSARDYVVMVLRDMGIQNIMTAHDGRAALKVFSDFEDGIDLIICDWKMPHMTGLEFLKQVRTVKATLPFLMVTALATLENVQEAMAHDVTAYIAKPFPPEQLEEKVLLLVNRPLAEVPPAAPSGGPEAEPPAPAAPSS